ncbi:elongator complex protein 4 [Pancytospora epiphaga]|nr:elongator complex protein 4 [Pancytospora epiphaga]
MVGFTKCNERSTDESFSTFFSTGIPTLDSLVKIQGGSITAIYEDENSTLHNMILQIFTSEALWKKRTKTYAFGMEAKHLYYYARRSQNTQEDCEHHKFTIAWRYNRVSGPKEEFDWNLFSKLELEQENIIKSIAELINLLKMEKGCLIVIYSIFAPLFQKLTQTKMIELLFSIRKYTKQNNHVIVLSIPAFLINTNLSPFFDNILELTAILLLPNEKSKSHAILTLRKTALRGALEIRNWAGIKYSIEVSSKSFAIQGIDIPPDDDVLSRNTGCSQQF